MSDNTDFERVLQDIREGRFVIVIDEEGPHTTGDLIVAAEHAGPDEINFMMQHAHGLLCVAMTGDRLDSLGLPLMVADGWDEMDHPQFTISVDAKGVSATDSAAGRAAAVRALIDDDTQPGDLRRPGHIFPTRAVDGGVLKRAGHTEAAVDLARLAGQKPAGVTCQIIGRDGTPASAEELAEFGWEYEIRVVSLADIIEYRRRNEELITREVEAALPTAYGDFRVVVFRSRVDASEYVAMVKGDIATCEAPLVRVHSGCVTGDILGSLKCDCGNQLHGALCMIEESGCGVLLYIAGHEGRGIGLTNKIKAYHLQDNGMDTVEANEALGFPADMRDYGIGAQVLFHLGVRKMRLLTNNPKKMSALAGYGLEVVERVPIQVEPNRFSERYLCTKRDKMGHMLDNLD
jgi:3,4-dihydroxy 2-butanone 4-phosphate synthase/GTP cyclohydrolase II